MSYIVNFKTVYGTRTYSSNVSASALEDAANKASERILGFQYTPNIEYEGELSEDRVQKLAAAGLDLSGYRRVYPGTEIERPLELDWYMYKFILVWLAQQENPAIVLEDVNSGTIEVLYKY
jgi:hypothetical protein